MSDAVDKLLEVSGDPPPETTKARVRALRHNVELLSEAADDLEYHGPDPARSPLDKIISNLENVRDWVMRQP